MVPVKPDFVAFSKLGSCELKLMDAKQKMRGFINDNSFITHRHYVTLQLKKGNKSSKTDMSVSKFWLKPRSKLL